MKSGKNYILHKNKDYLANRKSKKSSARRNPRRKDSFFNKKKEKIHRKLIPFIFTETDSLKINDKFCDLTGY